MYILTVDFIFPSSVEMLQSFTGNSVSEDSSFIKNN